MVVSQRCSFPLDPLFFSLSLLPLLPSHLSSTHVSFIEYWNDSGNRSDSFSCFGADGRPASVGQVLSCVTMCHCVQPYRKSFSLSPCHTLTCVSSDNTSTPVQTVLGAKWNNCVAIWMCFSLFLTVFYYVSHAIQVSVKNCKVSQFEWPKSLLTGSYGAYMGINWSYLVRIHRKGLVFDAKAAGRPKEGKRRRLMVQQATWDEAKPQF